MAYDAVCFDLDGTLLDTLDDLADSMNIVLERHGLATHPVDAYRTFVGDGVQKLVARSAGLDAPAGEQFEQLLAEYRTEYGLHWADKTKPYDGVMDMLNDLAAQGRKITVLSNKPHDFTQLCVEKFLPGIPFEVVQGMDASLPHKPDPAGAFRIAETLGLQPAQFAYLGDTNTDMQTATAAGMFAIGVTWGFRTADELRQYGAQALIDHPRDLKAVLEESH